MDMFHEAEAVENSYKRRQVPGALNDKTKLLQSLGYEVNASGEALPTFRRNVPLIYKGRKDTSSFLSGMLTQAERSSPIMATSLMWVASPVKTLRPCVWFVHKKGLAFEALLATPDVMYCTRGLRKATTTPASLWYCSRWHVTPRDLPVAVSDVLEALDTKFRLPEYFTVDCLGDRVFDVHGKIEVEGLTFDTPHTLTIGFEAAPDRPFYELDINTIHRTTVN